MHFLHLDRNKIKYGELTVLVFVIVFFLMGNIIWLGQDTSPATDPDANFYMRKTLAYVATLGDQHIGQMWQSIKDLNMEGRPPLYQLLSVPFVLVFGRSMDAGTYVNLLFSVLLLVAVYHIGKLAFSSKAGLLAAIITAGYPTLISLSHNYRPYFAVSACVALTVWLLLILQKERSIRAAWLLGLSIAFGLWIYPLYLWVAPIPAVVLCLYVVFFQPSAPLERYHGWIKDKIREPMLLYGLLPASLLSIVLVLVWYLSVEARQLIEIQNWVHSPAVTEFRGTEVTLLGNNDTPASIWWYAFTSPNAISTVFVVLFCVGVLIGFLKKHKVSFLILFVYFLIGYITLSLQGGLGWRYFSMLLPVAAVLTAIGIAQIENKFISNSIFFLCVVTSVLNYSIVKWGFFSSDNLVTSLLGVIKGSEAEYCSTAPGWGFCQSPPLKVDWPVSNILETVTKDPDCKKDSCNITVISRTGHIHWTVFAYYLVQDFPEMTTHISSSGNPDMGIPLNLRGLLNDQFLVYEVIPNLEGATFDDKLINFLLSQPAAFADAHKEVAEFALPNGNMVKLIKRVKPLTVTEAEQTFVAIDALDKYKVMQYDILAALYAYDGDFEKAQMYFQQGWLTGGIFQHFARTDIEHIKSLFEDEHRKLVQEYQDMLEQDPGNFDAHSGLAVIYQDINDCGQSLPHWEARLVTQNNYSTNTDLGYAYLECKELDKAISVFQSALEFDSKAPRARFGLALAFAEAGQVDAARRNFKRVIKDAPESDAARQAQEWLDSHPE